MPFQIIADIDRIFAFVRHHVKLNKVSGTQGLGLERDGALIAGVLYEDFNGHNVWMHVAAEPGSHWMTKLFLKSCFHYPFVTLGCSRVSGYVEAKNSAARRFDEHLGFRQEAVLKGAASDGGDVILYAMRRSECKYVNPKQA